jgi:two-component system, OmpR family, phosphate regulon sensor histidine kinase PhoR
VDRKFITLGLVGAFLILVLGLAVSGPLTVGIFGSVALASFSIWGLGKIRALQADLDHREVQNRSLAELARSQKTAVDAFSDGLEVGIFVCDDRAQIQYANRFAQGLFGFENPFGRSILAVTLSVDLEQLALLSIERKEVVDSEISFSFPKERICIARAWTTEQSPEKVYLSLVEVTDLRRMERVRRDFVANVSHELRTPMTVIRAYAETMQDDDDPELRERYLGRIVNEVDRLTSITQDLLILSTSESGPVRKGPCDLAETVQYAYNLLRPGAEEKGLKMSLTAPDSLMMEANNSQITQVVVNLIENSIKYTQEGGVDIQLSMNDTHAKLEVTDTGIGIAEEHLPRLFERFYRVDKARSRATGGTGLGLSIVKHIVEAHGGSVHVDSSLNQGTTFTVELPL